MYQVPACLEIIKYARKKGLNIWVYTGFTWEEIMKMAKKDNVYNEFLKYVDVLVDGRFENDKKDLNLLFRGSSNQRLIDMKKTF